MALFADQVAWVTGGGRGIGRAGAEALSRLGAKVAVSARTRVEIDEVAGELAERGGDARAFACDVSDWEQVIETVGQIEVTLGPIDILINNAGLLGPLAQTWQSPPREWARAVEVNLIGAYYCARAVLPDMIARRRGSIVNISSGAAAFAAANWSAYAASKAALDHFTRSLAVELEGTGVRANSLHPGIVETDMAQTLRAATPDQLPPHRRQFYEDVKARGEVIAPEMAGRLIAWLVASDMNGAVLDARDDPSLLEKADALWRSYRDRSEVDEV